MPELGVGAPERSPWEGLALAVGAGGCARGARLAEHAVLARLQDAATGRLPTHGALLGSQLEDHLQGETQVVVGSGSLPGGGPPCDAGECGPGCRVRAGGPLARPQELSCHTGVVRGSQAGGPLEG